MILMGLLAYLIYSLKIIYSIAWSLEEVVTELVVPMVLICVILNIAISIFWGSGLLLSDTNIDSVLALPIPLRTLILSKLTVLFMVEVALTVALLLPMMVLFGLTAGMGFPFYLIVLGITILFPVIPGLLGTMFGTQIYRILKNSSARIARLKAAAAILILFAFMVLLTIANGEVKTITPAETVKGTEIDEFSKQDYVNAGQKYSYAATGKLDGSFGIDELNNYDNKNLDDKTFDLYLDQYGYLIGIEQVEDDVEYVFITSYEITSKYMTNRTAKATAIFEDGTTKDIEVNLKKSDDDVVKDWTNRKDGKTNENRWYEYTVKNDSYELTLAATQIHDTDTDKIDSKHVSQKGVKNDGVTVDKNYYYGNADTNYITVSVDDVNGKVAVDKVESVVKGVKNVSINVWDEAKAKTEAELPNATDVTYGIYTVYEKNKAYARASIVVGDDGSVSDRYAYLYDEPNYERYNKSEDVYYWEMDAVIDGVKTTVTFKSDLPFKDTVLDTMKVEGGMFKLSYDKDGYAVDVDKLKEGIDNDYILLSDYMDQKPDDLNIITNKGEFTSEKVQVEKDTLWITDQTAKRGFALADKCPAVIVELNKDSKGNWEIDDTVEYTTVEKAVRSMETYDTKDKFATFEGEIYLMFKDGIVSSVVLVDKVAKDGHIKDNTTGKITEAAISKDASGKLVATWTDNKAYAGSKYVVDFYLVDGAKEYLKDTVTDISANNDTHSEVSSKIAQNGDYYAVIRILDKDGKVVASATTAVKGFAF